MAHLLVADDDHTLAGLIARALRHDGHDVMTAASGTEVVAALREPRRALDLLIVDWCMPEPAGEALLSIARLIRPAVPIITITGHSNEERAMAAVGLASKYLTKPLAISALLESVRALLAVPATSEPSFALPRIGAATLDHEQMALRLADGSSIALTPLEHRVLLEFLRHAGQLLSHASLAKAVAAEVQSQQEASAFCRRHVCALRKKLTGCFPQGAEVIQVVHGRGYRFLTPASTLQAAS